ncbi:MULTISPECIES: aldose 1-epimerase family protein [Cryobacterium]|uniref:Aldose 1-epimerase n=1 Tax=Cryobacterium levicorallinum TaxID=995038 RepID=A0A1I3ATR9_9MICO|nr:MULTISPECIES: aldose 1-epimerase family protein [Cryobacterium]TFB87981.1 aldose epimerase [Cryobacterium levicorallinum]TFD56380.1 aldose epimerase [Cryobacterium sp. Hh38]GEP26832.1 aldose 1-epimerase [Cryobacterium levicorallinum]SFH53422.1 aldose 1-epimerase [Cryobacterium levicorallinum]
MRAPTGIQYDLTLQTPSGTTRAVVTEVAAGLRAYSVNGIDLVETFDEFVQPPMAAGIVLVPWPNRIRDGQWTQNGIKRQLALTEPTRQNAIHGLLRFAAYRELSRQSDSVTLGATVFPQSGYPFHLETEVTYALTAEGLNVTHRVTNVGAEAAPVAVGAHPYLKIGDVPTGDLVVRVDAATHLDVDDRLNPTGETPVDDTRFDLRAGIAVGDLDLDDGFGGVGSAGEHTLTAADGRRVTLWGDENMRYVQVFTPRIFPVSTAGAEPIRGQAIAIEPMTAPADAFNSGAGLHWLEPGEQWVVRWGIRPTGFDLSA